VFEALDFAPVVGGACGSPVVVVCHHALTGAEDTPTFELCPAWIVRGPDPRVTPAASPGFFHGKLILFKGAAYAELFARVCADCGYAELYAEGAKDLYAAYQ
jgi:hypothetical protein